ncbi:IclR family transcriptional regulator [Blastopirellula marina]|uniref:Transcriptional regulator for glyoxylate bypass n=1 Tax=Blastopirellula marina DSM 3645 TaxID=314230 RepID=A3ZV96_9BACT|nr:IclR family transcriptional regulator [Blastopirellula marina]EAQ79242.1 transcriptional regulator for glyoxylate bypass [Blastopirellula marina DSM 3645]
MLTSSLGKAFHVLEVLASADGEMPLAEIVSELGYHKPTVHRLLQDLVELGYVCRIDKGKYQLTGKLRRMTLGKLDDHLLEAADPFLRQLHDLTGETVNLGVLRGTSIRYLQVLESRHPFRLVVEANNKDPFYSTALGRALTSELSEEEWNGLIAHVKLIARTPQTVIDPQKLREIHERVSQEGYAMEQDQNDIGVTCIGAPIRDGSGIVAAVSVSIPTARVDSTSKPQLIDAVQQTAAKISDRLSS